MDDPLVWMEGATTANKRWLHKDERGSVIAVTDMGGAILAINRYDPYGTPSPTNLGRFGYTGQTWLAEAQLWHYKARMYAPTLGRFLQTDPIGTAGGMNLYAYVGGDPVNFRDPSGLLSIMPRGRPCDKWEFVANLPCGSTRGGSGRYPDADALERMAMFGIRANVIDEEITELSVSVR